jgi:MFS family permease
MPGTRNENGTLFTETNAVVARRPSWRSWIGLCAASFFLAEECGVELPFVNTYLVECGWGYDAIGAAVGLAGLVSWLMNSPGGFLIDHMRRHRLLLAAASLLVGACFGLLPLVCQSTAWVFLLLAVASLGKPLFGPLTNALTLGLVGNAGLNRAVGIKEGWNHAGNIAAAATAMMLVSHLPVGAVFYAIAVVSVLAAASGLVIRSDEAGEKQPANVTEWSPQPVVPFLQLLRDRRVAILLVATTLFHLANAPVMPLVAQKIKHVGGSNAQVAAVVLVAQAVMIPVAVLAGLLGDRWGRRPVLAVGFAVLPLRIALYNLADDAGALVALQALDGVGAGIFGVATVAACGDLTNRRGHFNALMGVLGTAVGLGGVAGPLTAGFIVQHWGFDAAFLSFAGIAVAAATLLIGWMPETQTATVVGPNAEELQLCCEPESV